MRPTLHENLTMGVQAILQGSKEERSDDIPTQPARPTKTITTAGRPFRNRRRFAYWRRSLTSLSHGMCSLPVRRVFRLSTAQLSIVGRVAHGTAPSYLPFLIISDHRGGPPLVKSRLGRKRLPRHPPIEGKRRNRWKAANRSRRNFKSRRKGKPEANDQ